MLQISNALRTSTKKHLGEKPRYADLACGATFAMYIKIATEQYSSPLRILCCATVAKCNTDLTGATLCNCHNLPLVTPEARTPPAEEQKKPRVAPSDSAKFLSCYFLMY